MPPARMAALLQEFDDVFQLPAGVPPERPADHTTPKEEGVNPPFRSSFRLSPAEREEVEDDVKHLLVMGWIVPSTSPYGAPIPFVPKPDGTHAHVC